LAELRKMASDREKYLSDQTSDTDPVPA